MTKASPELSLIIAVYQRPDFLERVLTSLLNQTFRNMEIIIADDGSGPEIAAVAAAWQQRFAMDE